MTYTREQMMKKEVPYETYQRQFVTDGLIRYVERVIGHDRIIDSKDAYFNDIPLKEWDRLSSFQYINTKLWKEAEGARAYSLANNVCLAKTAAGMIREKYGKPSRYTVTVKFDNDDSLTTEISGTPESIKAYYANGKVFNLGNVGDKMVKVSQLIFLDKGESI